MSFDSNHLEASLKRTPSNAFTQLYKSLLYVIPIPLQIDSNSLYVSRYVSMLIVFNFDLMHFDCSSLHDSIPVIEESVLMVVL